MIARYLFIAIVACLLLVLACENPDNPTFGPDHPNPNPGGTPAAILTNVEPDSQFAGLEVIITGSGFSTEPSDNLVGFGNKVAEVTAATATQLNVIAPPGGGNVDIKVAVKGAEEWSNLLPFKFRSYIPVIANPEVTTIDDVTTWPMGVDVDDEGNVYFGSAEDGAVYKVTPAGEKTTFAEVPIVGAIHFGPEGYLYICEMWDGKIARISPDGSTVEDVVEVDNAVDFDWDEDGNMYISSNENAIFMMPPGGAANEVVPDVGAIKNLRVYDDYVYISKIWDGVITRFPIIAGGLGDEEIYMPEDVADTPLGFDFDMNGVMYWSHAWETSLFVYAPGGAETATFYEDELETPMRYMTYHGQEMYIVFPGNADIGRVFKVYIGVDQAPRYGRQ